MNNCDLEETVHAALEAFKALPADGWNSNGYSRITQGKWECWNNGSRAEVTLDGIVLFNGNDGDSGIFNLCRALRAKVEEKEEADHRQKSCEAIQAALAKSDKPAQKLSMWRQLWKR